MVILLLAIIPISMAEPASMWMEQNGNTINLMVNTSENSFGANAWIHFDSESVDITAIDFSGSPWQPLEGTGWSHQGDHVIITLTNFDGVAPGEYKIATMVVTGNGDSEITITKAEPVGVITQNITFTTQETNKAEGAEVIIGNGTGTTTIPIIVTNGDNVGAVDVTLSYDPSVVTINSVSDGDMDCTYTNLEHINEGWIRIGAVQGNNPGLDNFTLVNVNFEPASSDSQCNLELSVTTLKDSTPECIALNYTIRNGVYYSPKSGDANDDNVVDMADAAYIAKHVIGITGYETINEEYADVNGDGIIDMSDSMYLSKHIIGIAGYEILE